MAKGYRVEIVIDGDFLDFHTDSMIVKKMEGREYEIVALSLYGTRSDINKIKRFKNLMYVRVNSFRYRYEQYRIQTMDNYDLKEVKGTYTNRLTLVKKNELLLDQTKVVNPIVILPSARENELKKVVFEKVRESVAAPLFPDLTNPEQLSKELFIERKEAENILSNITINGAVTEDEIMAEEGIEEYHRWTEFLFDELMSRRLIRRLEVICFNDDQNVLPYEIIVKEDVIRDIISSGIQRDEIKISNQKNHWNHYTRFDEYMKVYAPILKEVIESQTNPLHRKGDIRKSTRDIISNLKRDPYPTQLETIEAMVKSIEYQRKVNVVGEPGVGKTFMMSTAAYLDAEKSNKPLKALILSPDHLVKTTWEKEIKEVFDDVKYHHIRSISDLRKFQREGYFEDQEHRFFILSQGVSKSGYSERPVVLWDEHRKVFKCPDCYETVKKRVINEEAGRYESRYIEVPVTFDHFRTQRYNNRKCQHCDAIFWGVHNRQAISGFAESIGGSKRESNLLYSNMGFVPRDPVVIRQELEEAVKIHNERRNRLTTSRLRDLREIEMIIQGKEPERNRISPYKVPVSYYIKKKMKGMFSHLIIDEYHQFQSNTTSRTESAAEIIASIDKVITGTGTMMNGYARSRFYNDFMLFPEKMKKAGFQIHDVEKYQVAFGVVENRFRLSLQGRRTTLAPKSKPGISPIIFPLFLQDSTVFISMKDLEQDMGDSLPKLKHEVVKVSMADELREGEKALRSAVQKATRGDLKLFKGLMPTLYAYLDMPTVEREVKDSEENVVYTTDPLELTLDHKLEELKKIVHRERREGRKTLVYTHYTSDGINDYLSRRLQQEGFRVSVLNKESEYSISCDGTESRVNSRVREDFIKDEVAKGVDVLIVNPILIQTGTNLIDFASIVYYQMSYQVYTVRQADRRTWRIGQTEDCTIYYLFYEDSFQEDIATLMATKVVASESIEGNMDSKGLEAITDDRTPEEELAKKFFEHMQL